MRFIDDVDDRFTDQLARISVRLTLLSRRVVRLLGTVKDRIRNYWNGEGVNEDEMRENIARLMEDVENINVDVVELVNRNTETVHLSEERRQELIMDFQEVREFMERIRAATVVVEGGIIDEEAERRELEEFVDEEGFETASEGEDDMTPVPREEAGPSRVEESESDDELEVFKDAKEPIKVAYTTIMSRLNTQYVKDNRYTMSELGYLLQRAYTDYSRVLNENITKASYDRYYKRIVKIMKILKDVIEGKSGLDVVSGSVEVKEQLIKAYLKVKNLVEYEENERGYRRQRHNKIPDLANLTGSGLKKRKGTKTKPKKQSKGTKTKKMKGKGKGKLKTKKKTTKSSKKMKPLTGVLVIGEDVDELKDRLGLVLGSIEAGNSSKELRNEAREIMDYLIKEKVLSKSEGKEIERFINKHAKK
jgi:hypothetical protein